MPIAYDALTSWIGKNSSIRERSVVVVVTTQILFPNTA